MVPRFIAASAALAVLIPLGCSGSSSNEQPLGGSGGSAPSAGTTSLGNGGSTSGGSNASGGAPISMGGASPASGGSAVTSGGVSPGGAMNQGGSAGLGAGGTSPGGASPGGAGGASAGTSAGGSGGATGACPEPPAGEPAAAVTALNAINALRVAMGVPCMELVHELDVSAQKHCDYYAANASDATCIADPHSEVATCTGFVGASLGARGKAAGYPQIISEVMAFTGDPNRAVSTWVNSVWHRTPILKPWIRNMGYGGTTTPAKCDTIDFGRGPTTPDTAQGVYPYSGQTGLATSFDGSREGPMPPIPATGSWPSGSPVTLFLRGATIQDHRIDVAGMDAPIDHVWIDETNQQNGKDQYFLYTNTPLSANTQYRVRINAMRAGAPLSFDWTFTTGTR